jgi:hypothetical protein
VDNPQQSINTFAAGAASGRVSFAPDNAAQTGTVTGGLTLPAHTRITGTALSTWMTQNDLFLPQTSNDSLARDPNFALTTLPRRSLDGHERLSMVNVSATSRPIDRLTLLARYRNFERTDQTAFFHLGALIVSDRTVTPADSETREPDPYTRMNSDFAVTFEAARGLALTGGYMLENWSRDINVRNTAETKEKGPSAAIDYIALDWLALHASHSWTRRRGDQYVISATEITNFRRFDLSDRDRQRTTLIATVTPLAVLDVSLNLRIADDKFPNSLYGTQRDKSIQHDADIAWAATPWLSLSAGYSVEDASNILNMRSRTGAVGSVTDDNPTYRWTNTNNDRNTTAYVGVSAMLIPDKLILTAGYSDIDAHFFVNNVNPITPSGGTAAQNLTATAENWPEVSQNLKPIALALSYRYSPEWAITARFASEQYVNTDFRTSPPLFAPFIGQTGTLPGSIGTVAGSNTGQYHFLGNAYLPYTANWFTLLVTFNPAAIPFVWGRPAL